MKQRASLQDGTYVEIKERLKQFNKETLNTNNQIWHRSCYYDATNQISIQLARDRLPYAVSTGSYAARKRGHKRTRYEMEESATPSSTAHFTRSWT